MGRVLSFWSLFRLFLLLSPRPMKTILLLTVVVFSFISSSANAAIGTFQQYSAWEFAVTNGILLPGPLAVITEDFNAYSGVYSNPLVGMTGPIEWNATAVSYVPNPTNLVVSSGWLSTQNTDENLLFSFSPGVLAVGGNFFSRDASFNLITALVGIFFEDGSSSIQFVTSTSGFSGFISNGLAISSLTVSVYAAAVGVNFAAVDNLYFGVPVPAPSAIALLGLAGLVGRRRR